MFCSRGLALGSARESREPRCRSSRSSGFVSSVARKRDGTDEGRPLSKKENDRQPFRLALETLQCSQSGIDEQNGPVLTQTASLPYNQRMPSSATRERGRREASP